MEHTCDECFHNIYGDNIYGQGEVYHYHKKCRGYCVCTVCYYHNHQHGKESCFQKIIGRNVTRDEADRLAGFWGEHVFDQHHYAYGTQRLIVPLLYPDSGIHALFVFFSGEDAESESTISERNREFIGCCLENHQTLKKVYVTLEHVNGLVNKDLVNNIASFLKSLTKSKSVRSVRIILGKTEEWSEATYQLLKEPLADLVAYSEHYISFSGEICKKVEGLLFANLPRTKLHTFHYSSHLTVSNVNRTFASEAMYKNPYIQRIYAEFESVEDVEDKYLSSWYLV
jgi:hypothetical protein